MIPLLLAQKTIYLYDRFDNFKYIFDYGVGVKSINDLVIKIDKLAEEYVVELLKFDVLSDQIIKETNLLKGDIFEIFSELFFGYINDEKISIRDYTPIPLGEDYGIDAIGINAINNKCAIQVKYRSNPFDLIDLASIAKTYASARLQQNISLEENNTIWLFTTANDATEPCKKVFGKILRIINRNTISNIDNNLGFWQYVEDRLILTIKGK